MSTYILHLEMLETPSTILMLLSEYFLFAMHNFRRLYICGMYIATRGGKESVSKQKVCFVIVDKLSLDTNHMHFIYRYIDKK